MSTTDAGIRQLKNGNWAYRFSISVNGQKISQRGSTNSEGQPLKTKTDAIRARKKAIKLAQLAPLLPVKEKEPEKLTVAQVFDEYREKGRSDRAYNTILKQDSLWMNHLQEAFGHRPLEEIEVAEISDYLAKLYYEEEYSFRYVESFLKMFYLIFGQAYSRGYLSVDRYNRLCVNKDTKIHMPKLKTDDDLDIVAFSDEECAVAFDHIKRKFTLHLSGTPFKALANDKFPENAIYNWTYADEQRAKRDWTSEEGSANPYATLPKLNMFTYQMSEIVQDELEQGVEINGETEEYAFDLNVFFETKNGSFVHESSVDKFLDAMTTQTKFPFSTPELRAELKHTFWLLNRVDSAKALAKKLMEHPVFKDYEIILAAGDGKLNEEEETKKSFDRVVEAIAKHEKTITLSVGQLTTGITVPEWSAVLMLSNIKSPALYMQAAFRAQNPCLFKFGGQHYRKENAYVFDFDPARTLTIYEAFANDLSAETSDGRGDSDMRKEHIRELLNFFPVIGEDEEGEMVELDAEKVLSIPRKIRSQEVVRRGFMSDYLFQNISNVFHAPQAVIDIITTFQPVEEPKNKLEVTHLSFGRKLWYNFSELLAN